MYLEYTRNWFIYIHVYINDCSEGEHNSGNKNVLPILTYKESCQNIHELSSTGNFNLNPVGVSPFI